VEDTSKGPGIHGRLHEYHDVHGRPHEDQDHRDHGGRLRSIRFNELQDPGARQYLLDGLIPEGYPTLLHGDGCSAKSMLGLSFGLAFSRKGALATQEVQWLGRDVGDHPSQGWLDARFTTIPH
jgi:hypothetical protein